MLPAYKQSRTTLSQSCSPGNDHISHLAKRNIIFKRAFKKGMRDTLVLRRVVNSLVESTFGLVGAPFTHIEPSPQWV